MLAQLEERSKKRENHGKFIRRMQEIHKMSKKKIQIVHNPTTQRDQR